MRKLLHEEILKRKPAKSVVKRKKRTEIYAILDNVRSLYNVGAIFRSSDGILLKKLYLCGITGCPPRKEISKTALGAEDIVPFEYKEEALEVVKKLKKKGVQIVVVELVEGAVSYYKAEYKFPVCFIFGHEVFGISDELVELADMAVEIPMFGRANSLNVATCYGIIVYDALNKFLNE